MLQKKRKFQHLDQKKRDTLYRHYSAGTEVGEIATILGVHRSTVYRELKHNRHPIHKSYLPDSAQTLSLGRRNRPGSKIKCSKQLQQIIQDAIAMLRSPEVIAGRLKRERFSHKISHESIYKWIYGEGKSFKLYQELARRKRLRGLRPSKKLSKSKIPNRKSIHERPEPPLNQLGHWESDTVYFSKGKETILTVYDKVTKVFFGAKMTSRKADETIDNLKEILKMLPKKMRRSITFDNGSEFTEHEQLQDAFGLKTYFCDAYAPWQKGGVENANGILRRYIPKRSKADDYTPEQVQLIFHRINMTPRKSLNYRTPYEMLLQQLTGKNRIIPQFNKSVAFRV